MTALLPVVFLAAGVLAIMVAAVGVVLRRGAMDQLHYVAFAPLVAAPLFAAAACLQQGWSAASAKVVLIAAVLLVQSPVLAHAVGRAIYRAEVQPRRHDGGRV